MWETSSCDFTSLDFSGGAKDSFHEELVYSIEGSPSGTAFRTMKALTLQSPFAGWLDSPNRPDRGAGRFEVRLLLPLISRISRLASWFSAGSETMPSVSLISVFLSQIANQIALAVENALAYREIRGLKEQLSEGKNSIWKMKSARK